VWRGWLAWSAKLYSVVAISPPLQCRVSASESELLAFPSFGMTARGRR
jgi:hypothetical protein